MKTLVLLRHGIPDLTDASNNAVLSDRGVVEVYEESKQIRDNVGGTNCIDIIYHSDTTRTLETAEILSKRIIPKKTVEEVNWLGDSDKILKNFKRVVKKNLQKHSPDDENVILVTHEPNITKFLKNIYGSEVLKNYNENKAIDPFATMNKAIIFKFNTNKWSQISKRNLREVDVVEGSSTKEVTDNAKTKRSLADYFGYCAFKLPKEYVEKHSTISKTTMVSLTPLHF